jgi:two-component system, response regulator / RNA-binding antiterminator
MSSETPDPLRVLIANERKERLQTTTGLVAAMGHHVIARSLEVSEVAAATAEAMPDVALVGLGESSEHALGLISQIVQEATCPVIAILESNDAEFVNEAAKRGIFAYVTDGDPEELQGAVDIVLRRFAEFHRLEGALGRRALTERAKGILMERYWIDEQEAFELLRTHSRQTGRKLIDVAEAVTTSHLLLVRQPTTPSNNSQPSGVRAEDVPSELPGV